MVVTSFWSASSILLVLILIATRLYRTITE
jgi:hypothetical protein